MFGVLVVVWVQGGEVGCVAEGLSIKICLAEGSGFGYCNNN